MVSTKNPQTMYTQLTNMTTSTNSSMYYEEDQSPGTRQRVGASLKDDTEDFYSRLLDRNMTENLDRSRISKNRSKRNILERIKKNTPVF